MKIVTLDVLKEILARHGIHAFLKDLMRYLKADFSLWHDFTKSPRYAAHGPDGVVELMPIFNSEFFAYKFVNGHPKNPTHGKLTVIATGQLASLEDGYPLLFSEMTILTALRTAATAALAADLLANQNARNLAIIGTGAQSEFQILAHRLVRPIDKVRYYDYDRKAMDKFAQNLAHLSIDFIPCQSIEEAVSDAHLIITATAAKSHGGVIHPHHLKPGVHLNALGGDCPGKTELAKEVLFMGPVYVEYLPQTIIEGDIQQLTADEVSQAVHGELWELITYDKPGRTTAEQITIFDCVGFALEDYSTLRLVHELAEKYGLGIDLSMVPHLDNSKDLFSLIKEVAL